LRVTAPEKLRHRLRALSTKELVGVAARFRLGDDPRDLPAATKFALRSVARRYEALSREIAQLDAQLDRLVGQVAPELVSLAGIGTDHAATLLIVAGDNPKRLRSEASFASLCGVSPVEASSGKVVRHRLNRGGNREANRALYMICLARMRRDLRTKEYVAQGAPRRARASERSSAASSATSPGRPTACWSPLGAAPLDYRSVTSVNRARAREGEETHCGLLPSHGRSSTFSVATGSARL
jgi:transposase